MKVFVHTDGTIGTMTEEELMAIPQYPCEQCGWLFRTTTDRRICDECMREKVHKELFN